MGGTGLIRMFFMVRKRINVYMMLEGLGKVAKISVCGTFEDNER